MNTFIGTVTLSSVTAEYSNPVSGTATYSGTVTDQILDKKIGVRIDEDSKMSGKNCLHLSGYVWCPIYLQWVPASKGRLLKVSFKYKIERAVPGTGYVRLGNQVVAFSTASIGIFNVSIEYTHYADEMIPMLIGPVPCATSDSGSNLRGLFIDDIKYS